MWGCLGCLVGGVGGDGRGWGCVGGLGMLGGCRDAWWEGFEGTWGWFWGCWDAFPLHPQAWCNTESHRSAAPIAVPIPTRARAAMGTASFSHQTPFSPLYNAQGLLQEPPVCTPSPPTPRTHLLSPPPESILRSIVFSEKAPKPPPQKAEQQHFASPHASLQKNMLLLLLFFLILLLRDQRGKKEPMPVLI